MNNDTRTTPSASSATRAAIRARYAVDEADAVRQLADRLALAPERREAITAEAALLIRTIRDDTDPTMMEAFLDEYGLSTDEGVGLMCLAEALLRVPDAETIDDLIEDKIAPSDWSAHLGQSFSPLVNASTWALMLTGRLLDADPSRPASGARRLIKRLGEPVVRTAVARAMKIMGQQFVLGQTIEEGIRRAEKMRAKGYTYSYDMLGEGARTDADAQAYFDSYAHVIAEIAKSAKGDVRANAGISVKLSALSPRYLTTHRGAIEGQVIPRCLELARMAAKARIGFNIDAEEQDRLDVSLDVVDTVLADASLAGWDGFGVVVQAYGKRAPQVLEHLFALAERLDRRIMVRLVKGAYWDTEIKLAQELGAPSFPVFTRKVNTDVSYLACAKMLQGMRARIYPQFATHNAHTCAAVLATAGDKRDDFEFQRLHGMGESLHETLRKRTGVRCRIYAPCGPHKDLLAYLVRRLLENGANSSFVNQIVNEEIAPETIAADPLARALEHDPIQNPGIRLPRDLFAPSRVNSRGCRIEEPALAQPLIEARDAFAATSWTARPMLAGDTPPAGAAKDVRSPADGSVVGRVHEATEAEVARALEDAHAGFAAWSQTPTARRADTLRRVADLYEAHMAEFCAIAAREAGKILLDGVAEVREAVDFLRYYAAEAERLDAEDPGQARGVFVCISPWNFPLAIFTGQVAAALAAGNAVVAKPAEQTPIIATRATELFRAAGVPAAAFQLLPGDGPTVGGPLTSDARIAGVCFTGSTDTAQRIHQALAAHAPASAVLIAETGGLNAMIVDSTALPEQAVDDIVASAFQSAGQRCSALRMLYLQEDTKDRVLEMLEGAMDALVTGDPWSVDTDVAPLIDAEAQADIAAYIDAQQKKGRVRKRLDAPRTGGHFVGATLVEVDGIEDLEREIFGPVLHVATFKAQDIDAVVDAINARGFGLTFGLHTRIDDRVQRIVERIRVGNVYVNRNQIGAIVGSQPFGGEGLSGTGPKAGGPHYVNRFRRTEEASEHAAPDTASSIDARRVGDAFAALDATAWSERSGRIGLLRRALDGQGGLVRRAVNAAASLDSGPFRLPGPTGESNRLTMPPKGPVLCLGPETETALAQAAQALAAGCAALVVAPGAAAAVAPLAKAGAPVAGIDGTVPAAELAQAQGFASVAAAGDSDWTRALRQALASRIGRIVSLETGRICPERYYAERHICIDTTAAGGNTSLLAAEA